MKRGPKPKRRSLWAIDLPNGGIVRQNIFLNRPQAYDKKLDRYTKYKTKAKVKRFVEMSDEEYRRFIKEN